MNYDEDLLVELIADSELSHEKIAEQVGVCRRTVWRIANGHTRRDLYEKIADTVEGYRQAALRVAARHMKPLLEKQVEVALEGDGETSRRAREFLLTTFMKALATEPAQAADKRRARLKEKEFILADAKFKIHMEHEIDALYHPDRPEFYATEEDRLADMELYEEEQRIEKEYEEAERLEREAIIKAELDDIDNPAPHPTSPAPAADPACPVAVQAVLVDPDYDPEDELRTRGKMEDPFIASPRRMREASEEAMRSALAEGPIRRRGSRYQ